MSTRRFAIITTALMCLVASGCSDEPDSDAGDTGSEDVSVTDTADAGPGDATDTTDAASDAGSDTGETGDIADAGDTSSGLSWETCHSDYECTDVEVPLDYETSGGETMTIPVIRKPAANPSEKIGTVMFNFGGPGASGVTIAANDMFPLLPVGFPKIHKRFDVVVVEPRGTAKSSPAVDCLDDTEIDAMRQLDTMPDNESDWNELASNWESFVDGCLDTHSKKYLAEINTENVVRDMDTVRQKLGEETINFVGVSYGTYVGALYANMYPDRVRAFALDSNMHPTRQNLVDHIGQGAEDLSQGLDQFFDECGSDDSCPFHGGEGAAAVESALSQLFSDLESSPLELDNGRKVTTRDATMALVATLRDGAHDKLANALSDAESGDGQKLIKFADVFWMRNDDGSYGSFIEAYITNMIADSTCPDDFDRQDLKSIRSRAQEERPFLGRLEIGIAHACTAWPDVGNGSPDIEATDAPPMLIVNAEGDSATPMKNAEAMQSALDNGSHLLRWEGRKHGVLTESACTREAIQAFLIDPGTAPETTTCSD